MASFSVFTSQKPQTPIMSILVMLPTARSVFLPSTMFPYYYESILLTQCNCPFFQRCNLALQSSGLGVIHIALSHNGDCSHEIKRRLLLGRKVMTNLDSIFKSRDITLPTKVCLVKAMVFPVVMYGCESWTVKKAERRRIDAFELWC